MMMQLVCGIIDDRWRQEAITTSKNN
jgi:hypothetical protein